jgi:hypothetical protein
MTTKNIWHVLNRPINTRQRCERCGVVIREKEPFHPAGQRWLETTDEQDGMSSTTGQSLPQGAPVPNEYEPCFDRPWTDEMQHVAGTRTDEGSLPCERCGEDLAWLFAQDEPTSGGTLLLVRLTKEEAGQGFIVHSGAYLSPNPALANIPRCPPRG